jgi:hypothetical protein
VTAFKRHRANRLRPRGRLTFALALGLSDGIINALTLASATVLRGVGLSYGLSARVGVFAFASAVLTLFVAEYAQNRLELIRAERQLMFTRSGRLAATSLGRAVLRDSIATALLAGAASLAGAVLPLLIGMLLPWIAWIALVISTATLGGLGVLLANVVGGRRILWAVSLTIAGVALTLIGIRVDLV